MTRAIPIEELRALSRRSDLRGLFDVVFDWAFIAAIFAVVAEYPNAFTIVAGVILLGGRQLALAILMHEAAHSTLFRTRFLNETIGQWFCARPVWGDMVRYRHEHLEHHRTTGTKEDPDLGLVTPYPSKPSALRRRFLRDIVGITGLRRILGHLLVDFGFYSYSASTNAKRISGKRSFFAIVGTGVKNLYGVVLVNVALACILAASGHAWLYWLWVGAYLTTYSLFLRIRAIAEHAGTPDRTSALLNTRSIGAGWLARLTVAPHHVNFHLEHHIAMSVPHYRLRALQRTLRARGTLDRACVVNSYGEALLQATGRERRSL